MSRKRMLVDHGFRLPSAMDNRPLKFEEFVDRIGQTVYLSATPGNYELGLTKGDVRRAGHPPDRADRPRDRRQADQGPDRRPGARDPRTGRAQRAGAGHHADQEDVRGPHRLPARTRHPGALPALRGRHAAPGRAAARAADGRVRRAGRHQPAARGPRPARGVAGVDPGRRQGGLPALGHLADPDHRPRRPQRVRPGAHVRRHGHAVDGARRSTRPTGAARSRSPTTPSTASTRPPLRKRIADITDLLAREAADTEELLGACRSAARAARSRAASPGARQQKSPAPGRGGAACRPVSSAWAPTPSGGLDVATMPRAELADLIQQLNDQMLGGRARAAVRGRRPAARRDRGAEEGAARHGRRRRRPLTAGARPLRPARATGDFRGDWRSTGRHWAGRSPLGATPRRHPRRVGQAGRGRLAVGR